MGLAVPPGHFAPCWNKAGGSRTASATLLLQPLHAWRAALTCLEERTPRASAVGLAGKVHKCQVYSLA